MNRSFHAPPSALNQEFESGGAASGFPNGITWPSFITRTDAAPVATLVAWTSSSIRSRWQQMEAPPCSTYRTLRAATTHDLNYGPLSIKIQSDLDNNLRLTLEIGNDLTGLIAELKVVLTQLEVPEIPIPDWVKWLFDFEIENPFADLTNVPLAVLNALKGLIGDWISEKLRPMMENTLVYLRETYVITHKKAFKGSAFQRARKASSPAITGLKFELLFLVVGIEVICSAEDYCENPVIIYVS